MPTKKYKTELKTQYMILGIETRQLVGEDYDYKIYPEVTSAYYDYRASAKDERFDSESEALDHAVNSEYWQGTTFMIQKVYKLEIDWTQPLN